MSSMACCEISLTFRLVRIPSLIPSFVSTRQLLARTIPDASPARPAKNVLFFMTFSLASPAFS